MYQVHNERVYVLIYCAHDRQPKCFKTISSHIWMWSEIKLAQTGSTQGAKQCGCNHSTLNQIEPVPFVQCGQALIEISGVLFLETNAVN